ncbi:MAG TPA: hypothetical protein VHX61_09095 [Rhizomicrobium sp.]|jgi:hypothetical protein|nr:hypothetical protein [Rhizomicrobium sp.]
MGSSSNDTLTFTSVSAAPPLNGLWRVVSAAAGTCSTTCEKVYLAGASYTGPTYGGAAWSADSQVVLTYDPTNIEPGQFLCASGSTWPCTGAHGSAPAGWTASSSSSNDIGNKFGSGSGTACGPQGHGTAYDITVTSVTNWPLIGYFQDTAHGSEWFAYTIRSQTGSNNIAVTARCMFGTSLSAPVNNDTLVPSPPVVQAVFPQVGPNGTTVVWVSATSSAASSSPTAVQFLNCCQTAGSGSLGFIVANFGYHIWTANTVAGPAPDGVLTTCPSSTGCTTGAHHTITLTGEDAGNWYKLFQGMSVSDLTSPGNVAQPCFISATPTTAVIRVTGSGSNGCTGTLSFSGDQIQFSGCGYTPGSPQLGNCVATSFLCGSPVAGSGSAQGVVVDWLHPFGNRIQVHSYNCPAASMSDTVIAGGGGVGDQLDPYSTALWCEGKCDKDNASIGRLGGASIAILNNPSQPGDFAIANMEIAGNIVTNDMSQFTMSSVSGSSNVPQIIFESQGSSTTLSGNSLPGWYFVTDNPAATQNLFCAGNQFSSLLCGPPLPTLVENLPACNASWLGQPPIPVTDATSVTYLGTLAGGGSTYTHALCNGTNWVAD